MKSDTQLPVTIGDIARALKPREGELLSPSERRPKYFISPRAKDFWHKLCTWYGTSKMDDFGEYPSVEVCKAIDAIRHRDDMSAVLVDVKSKHPAWPPTTPQLDAIIRSHIAPSIDWAKLQCDLGDYVVRKYWDRMSRSQRIQVPRWQWYNDGVAVPAGSEAGDEAPAFFVSFADAGIVVGQL